MTHINLDPDKIQEAQADHDYVKELIVLSQAPKKHPKRGFASMDPEKQRAIAKKGGRHAHELGKAHQWTREEAAMAGRKGGSAPRKQKEEV